MTVGKTTLIGLQIQSIAICALLVLTIYAISKFGFDIEMQSVVIRSIVLSSAYLPLISLAAFIVSELSIRQFGEGFTGLVPISWGWLDWILSGGAAVWAIVVMASNSRPQVLISVVLLVARAGMSIGEAISSWRHRPDDSRV